VRTPKFAIAALALAAGLVLGAPRLLAHPHVWVSVKATVLYANGTITGLEQAWTFDEFYTAQAIQGLDADGDGKYSREELKELAQVNIDGLKEFDYFTHAKLGDGALAFSAPVDYWLEHTDKGILTLHFRLPLEHAVLAEAPGFNFSVFDPSYFIAFTLDEKAPVKLGASAPSGCRIDIHDPMQDDDDTQRLNEAFSSVMGNGGTVGGGTAGGGTVGSVGGDNQTVAVSCAKS
jgi:ABC-type uncharacterized transport system substrate-binding protein